MGKGQIITDIGDGEYTVKIVYGGRDRLNARINILNDAIADLQTRIDAETDEYQKSLLRLQKAALEKSKSYLQGKFPDDYETDIFCADYTEGLSGYVGTVEVPGEDQFIQIQPGYDGNAAYSSTRDGELWPAVVGSPSWCFFNQCLLPGWQKWHPTFRYALIQEISYATNTCRIEILPAQSSQQSLNINQGQKFFGSGTTSYAYTDREPGGWAGFKSRYPSHPLCTNNEPPETLASTTALVNQIYAIDQDVNSKHLYETDASYRRAGDYWAIMAGDDANPQNNERGDCEDFALTKADKLINDLGLSPRNMQIATCWTRDGDYHACLLIPTTSHGTLVLDINLIGRPTKAKLDASGFYSWDLFLVAGGSPSYAWADYSVEVFDVEIDYMNCNASVFSVGDEVLVEFEGQDWNQPKVIGFRSNPVNCDVFFYQIFGWSGVQFKTNMVDKTWQTIPQAQRDPGRSDVGTCAVGSGALCVGGWWSDPIEKFNTVDLLNGTAFIAKTDIPGPARGQVSCFEISGKAYAVGGSDYYTGVGVAWTVRHKLTHEFSPDENTWAAKTDMNYAVDTPAGGHNIGNLGYVFGGGNFVETVCQDKGKYFPQPEDYVQVYAPITDSWANKNSMSNVQQSRIQFGNSTHAFICGSWCYPTHSAAINPLYDCGGGSYEWAATNALNRYDPVTDSWSLRGSMNDFQAPAQNDADYPMTATAAQGTRGCADSFEENGYIHTRTLNGTGLIEWNVTAEAFSLFSDQEPYEPCGTCSTGQYSSGCVA